MSDLPSGKVDLGDLGDLGTSLQTKMAVPEPLPTSDPPRQSGGKRRANVPQVHQVPLGWDDGPDAEQPRDPVHGGGT